MERHLGRQLLEDETVDHFDRDFTNNDLKNLRVVKRGLHAKEDALYVEKVMTPCPVCSKPVNKNPAQVAHNRKLGKAGPFCSRSCAGKYGAEVQNKRIKPLKVGHFKDKRKYYHKNKPV